MPYTGKVELARERKLRTRNTRLYRTAHWPLWIWVFFLAPGPLTFSLFAHGLHRGNLLWLSLVLLATGIAALRGSLPGAEPRPYILRFDEDKPNPPLPPRLLHLRLERRPQLRPAQPLRPPHRGRDRPLVPPADLPRRLRAPLPPDPSPRSLGKLPRVGRSTLGEGTERRYFYGSVWAVTLAQAILMLLWKLLPHTRPILRGESMLAD
jgi:hypothetical protein